MASKRGKANHINETKHTLMCDIPPIRRGSPDADGVACSKETLSGHERDAST